MNLQVFSNSKFGEVRVAKSNNGEALFCLADVCNALGIINHNNVKTRLNPKGIHTVDTPTNGGLQPMVYVDEGNIYKTTFQSRKPEAEAFQDWLCYDVAPSIRKHGVYATESFVEKAISDPDAMISVLTELKSERQQRQLAESKAALQEEINLHNMPRVRFAQAVETSSRSCLMAELAKIITQNGYEIGQNRLFKWMRSNGYLGKTGEHHNMPTQRAMETGLFEIKKTSITKPDGTVLVSTTPKVTGKGQVYFVNKFSKALED
jgi:anti-repressor protein